jgi:hypothetical protein
MDNNNADDEAHKRILAGADHGDAIPEEVLGQASDVMKERWLGIFIALNNHHRFRKMLEANYIIRDVVDDEAKTIDTQVIEKPTSVGPPLTGKQLWKMRQALQANGCSDIDKAFNDVMKVLGQEDTGAGIIMSSDVDSAQTDMKRKLDA